MDYEKKYKEALERARQFSEKPYLEDSKGIVDYIFPELKESEVERTRKEILDYIIKGSESLYDVQQYGKERFEKWIAWLEKQGEQNLANSAKTCKDVEQKFADDIERKYNPCYNMSFEEAQEYISNRGFDIPWTDCDVFVDFRYVTQTIANILCWADNNPKQKPAWSEEDEDILNTIINHFKIDIECTDEDDVIRWLKSLRPQKRK